MSRKNTINVLDHIDPALLEECAIYRLPSERNGMKTSHKSPRRLAVLIAAVVLLLALAVTAYATGAIQTLISKYWGSFSYVTPDDTLREERPDYAAWLDSQLETQAMMLDIGENAIQTERPYPIPGGDGAGITLLEYYYDGEKIALGCQLLGKNTPVDFSFEPEAYPNLPFQAAEKDSYPSYTGIIRDAAVLETINEKIETEGSVSFLAFDGWLSDHVYAQGEDLGCCHTDPDENGFFLVDPVNAGIGEVTLPEKCRNLPEIEVSLTYRVAVYAFKLEGNTVQRVKISQTDYPVCFTIPNLNPASIPAKWTMADGMISDGRLTASAQFRGTTITIDSALPASDLSIPEMITLRGDDNLWQTMGRELVMERFPQIEGSLKSGATDIGITDEASGRLLLSFELSAEGIPGMVHYLDVERDLNGSRLDPWETAFTPHYITSQVPEGVTMTAEDAALDASSLLKQYSCFEFAPWNIQAEYDDQKQEGYYRMTLQPYYQGLPVYGQRAMTRVFESSQGIFSCSGLLALKEESRIGIQNTPSMDQAVESFVNNIPALSTSDRVQCSAIRLGYLAQAGDDEMVLIPAWVFECSEEPTDTQQGHVSYFEAAYLIQDGTLWSTQNGMETIVEPQ